jgi:hypothetical protein
VGSQASPQPRGLKTNVVWSPQSSYNILDAPSRAVAVTWQPISTAPSNQRILICDDRGHVKVARQGKLRWYDDAETLIARPIWWMPLPAAPSEAPAKEPEGKARKGRRYR